MLEFQISAMHKNLYAADAARASKVCRFVGYSLTATDYHCHSDSLRAAFGGCSLDIRLRAHMRGAWRKPAMRRGNLLLGSSIR